MFLNAIWMKSPTALEPILSEGPKAYLKSIDIPPEGEDGTYSLQCPINNWCTWLERGPLILCVAPGALTEL